MLHWTFYPSSRSSHIDNAKFSRKFSSPRTGRRQTGRWAIYTGRRRNAAVRRVRFQLLQSAARRHPQRQTESPAHLGDENYWRNNAKHSAGRAAPLSTVCGTTPPSHNPHSPASHIAIQRAGTRPWPEAPCHRAEPHRQPTKLPNLDNPSNWQAEEGGSQERGRTETREGAGRRKSM